MTNRRVPKLKSIELFNPEIGEFIIQKYREGFGYERIAKMVEEQFGYKVSHMSISRFLKKKFYEMGKALEGNPELKAKAEDLFLDTVTQMKQLNQKLWDLMNKLKATKANVPEIIAIAREIRSHVELQNKLLGKIQTGTQINIGKVDNVNTISVAMLINQYLEKMEKKGYIIIKRNLKHIDAKQNFEKQLEEKLSADDEEEV